MGRSEFLEFARDWTGEAIRCLPDDVAIASQRAEVLMLQQEFQAALDLWNRADSSASQPRAFAARVLCAIEAERPAPTPTDNAEEIAVSRAFVEWYRRLVNAGAKDAVVILNARVDSLRAVLPTAARVLDAVVAEAGRGELVAR